MLTKTKHWCLLANIKDVSNVGRVRVLACTVSGEELIVHFHHDRGYSPTTFSWTDLKPGSSLAIMYAYNKMMVDMTQGVRVECLDSVFVFKANVESLLNDSDQLLQDAIAPRCFTDGCDVQSSLLRCGRCHIARYCCKDHQKAAWVACHKVTCSQLPIIKQLMAIEIQPFEGHLNFRFEVERQPTAQERQLRADTLFFDTVLRMEGVPSSTASITLPLQRLSNFMSSNADWAVPIGESLGEMRRHVESLLKAPFPASCLGRAIGKSIARAQQRFQHSITDLQAEPVAQSSRFAGITFGGDEPLALLVLESTLAHLPIWCVEAGAPLQLYLQVDFPQHHESKYKAATGWTILACDDSQLTMRHDASGVFACLCDEPGLLAEFVKINKQAPFPLMVLEPHIARKDETIEIIRKSPSTPHMFTMWIRADLPGSTFRRNAVLQAAGLNEIEHVIQSMTDAAGLLETLSEAEPQGMAAQAVALMQNERGKGGGRGGGRRGGRARRARGRGR